MKLQQHERTGLRGWNEDPIPNEGPLEKAIILNLCMLGIIMLVVWIFDIA